MGYDTRFVQKINFLEPLFVLTGTLAANDSTSINSSVFTVVKYYKLVGMINATQNGTFYINQGVSYSPFVTFYTTTIAVVGGTPMAFSVEMVAPWCQYQYVNGVTATSIKFAIFGKSS